MAHSIEEERTPLPLSWLLIYRARRFDPADRGSTSFYVPPGTILNMRGPFFRVPKKGLVHTVCQTILGGGFIFT